MALAAAIQWEVRTTGVDTNGGGFKAGASGTDYSQQDAAQYTFTTATTAAADAIFLDAQAAAVMVGNVLNITGGTNFITGRYEVVSVVAGVSMTLDRNCTTGAGTAGAGKLGGALLTVSQAVTSMVGSNTVWIKAGTYLQTAALTPPAGTSGAYSRVIGYNTTRGDLDWATDFTNHPILQNNNTTNNVFTASNDYTILRSLVAHGGTAASKSDNAFRMGSTYGRIENCKALNFTGQGFLADGTGQTFTRCWATANIAGAARAFDHQGTGTMLIACVASGLTCPGFRAFGPSVFLSCVAANNTGGSSHGFELTGVYCRVLQSVAYANGGDGIRISAGVGAEPGIFNTITVSNSGYGINSSGGVTFADGYVMDYNAFYNNTTAARNLVPTGAHDVTLTGDPFTNGAGGDFTLNNTASAGAACRAAGFPGVLIGL